MARLLLASLAVAAVPPSTRAQDVPVADPEAPADSCELPADWPATADEDVLTSYFECLTTKCHNVDPRIFDDSGDISCDDVVSSGVPCESMVPGSAFALSFICPSICDQCADESDLASEEEDDEVVANTTEEAADPDPAPNAEAEQEALGEQLPEEPPQPQESEEPLQTEIVVDGCQDQNTEVVRETRLANGTASVRCCSTDGNECTTGELPGGCHAEKTFFEAQTICAYAGLRLCSEAEIESRVCCGTGCGYDGHQVWIAEPPAQVDAVQTIEENVTEYDEIEASPYNYTEADAGETINDTVTIYDEIELAPEDAGDDAGVDAGDGEETNETEAVAVGDATDDGGVAEDVPPSLTLEFAQAPLGRISESNWNVAGVAGTLRCGEAVYDVLVYLADGRAAQDATVYECAGGCGDQDWSNPMRIFRFECGPMGSEDPDARRVFMTRVARAV